MRLDGKVEKIHLLLLINYMIYSLFIGRYQPFHKGHKTLIKKVLDEGKNVCIACRDTKISKDNPYNYKQRKKMIRKEFPDKERVKIISIPDIESIVIGREVGYNIERIILDEKTEKVSATSIRDKLNNYAKTNKSSGKIIWGVDGIKQEKSNK